MKYNYTAIAKDGKREAGSIEATSFLAAGHLLKEQGLMPLELKEEKKKLTTKILESFGGVSLKDRIVFIEDLQIMLKSGIAAPRALKMIAKQSRNSKFKNILSTLATSVESGKSLHESMEVYPNVFSHIFVSMIKVGEVAGNLEKSLEYLAIQLERESELKSKTKGAMIYPAVIVAAMVIIGVLMGIFVLPKLTSTFKEMNVKLPLMTRIVIFITDTMSAHAVLTIGGLIGLVIGFVLFLRTSAGKRAFDWFLLHMLLVGPVVKKINLARFARILSSMLKSGIAIVEGIDIAADSLGNSYYVDVLKQASQDVRVGQPLTKTLDKHEKLFPYIVVQMLEVGEETGSMETILEQLAQHFEAEVDNIMRNISSIIEPLLLLVIGAVVGVLALALIMPIYNISQTVS